MTLKSSAVTQEFKSTTPKNLTVLQSALPNVLTTPKNYTKPEDPTTSGSPTQTKHDTFKAVSYRINKWPTKHKAKEQDSDADGG